MYRDYYLDPAVEGEGGGGGGGYIYQEDYESGQYKAYQSQVSLNVIFLYINQKAEY